MLASTESIVKQKVGVRFYPATAAHPPIRHFYPTCQGTTPYKWLQERGVSYYLEGYVRMASRSWLLVPIIQMLSLFLPVRWRPLPNVYSDAALSTEPHPAIVFSHGLTGTGQENSLLLASWASLGFHVFSVHHMDGSSSRVRLPDGTDLDYQPGPPFKNYDANFRPKQVEQRARELLQSCDFVEKECSVAQWTVAGFSYGAAAAARAATMDPRFRAAIFLDGWFYIDVGESAGIEFRFPEQAFQDNALEDIQCIFINSEEFSKYPKLFKATSQLANQSRQTPHVVLGTGHQNFCDGIFWAPLSLVRFVLRRALGNRDPVDAYREIATVSSNFLIRCFKNKEQ